MAAPVTVQHQLSEGRPGMVLNLHSIPAPNYAIRITDITGAAPSLPGVGQSGILGTYPYTNPSSYPPSAFPNSSPSALFPGAYPQGGYGYNQGGNWFSNCSATTVVGTEPLMVNLESRLQAAWYCHRWQHGRLEIHRVLCLEATQVTPA